MLLEIALLFIFLYQLPEDQALWLALGPWPVPDL